MHSRSSCIRALLRPHCLGGLVPGLQLGQSVSVCLTQGRPLFLLPEAAFLLEPLPHHPPLPVSQQEPGQRPTAARSSRSPHPRGCDFSVSSGLHSVCSVAECKCSCLGLEHRSHWASCLLLVQLPRLEHCPPPTHLPCHCEPWPRSPTWDHVAVQAADTGGLLKVCGKYRCLTLRFECPRRGSRKNKHTNTPSGSFLLASDWGTKCHGNPNDCCHVTLLCLKIPSPSVWKQADHSASPRL